MFSRTRVLALAFAVANFATLSPANAGQLFPPNNIGANPNIACPNGQLLSWQGDHVDCTNPTPGVTISCPEGQVLTGIASGVPSCTSSQGGGSAWVNLGSPNQSRYGGWDTYVNFPPEWGGPDQVCKRAGYNAYAGSCKDNEPYYGAQFQGTIWSNQTGVDNNTFNGERYWTFTCVFGSGAYYASSHTEILCVK